MVNSTQVSYFILDAYFDTGMFKYLYFILLTVVYLILVAANVLLIVVICVNRSLHEPMYLFLCSLFVNELYGSTGLFPFLLIHILRDVHTVSTSLCFLQVYCVYSYGLIEFLTLSVMSYDRYLAICHPLQYNTRMTSTKVAMFTAVIWFYPILVNGIIIYGLTAPLRLCGNVIDKVYCDNYCIVKLACSDTTVNNVFGLVHVFTVIFFLIIFILYSYMRILKVCFSGSKQTRHKAVSTCSPHLASVINFSLGAFFELLQSRFYMTNIPSMVRIFLSLYWLTGQPFVNPLLYGLKMTKIRIAYKTLVYRKRM